MAALRVFLLASLFGLSVFIAVSISNLLFVKQPLAKKLSEEVIMDTCEYGKQNCPEPLIIHFHTDIDGRPYVRASIDGKEMDALLDTGSASTLIDSKLTGVPSDGGMLVRDFHDATIFVGTANMKVCIEKICDFEDVAIVPSLSDKTVIRGSFFRTFHTALFDYKADTITLSGWR